MSSPPSGCAGCGREDGPRRDGLCLDCWYSSEDRPKPVRDRYAKLARLHEAGVEPFAYSFEPSHTLPAARLAFEAWEGHAASDDEASDAVAADGPPAPRVRVAGRIASLRDLGGSAFAHLIDAHGRLQIHLKRNLLGDEASALLDLLDLGDWIGVEGEVFRTRRGEVTVRVEELALLSKTLRPLPFGKVEVTDEGERIVHSGFRNVEARYRQRYADLAVNPEVREIFRTRAAIVSGLRRWLDARDYVEVETPILQPLYGGALARPFTTYHETLDSQLYLRIADELYLKRLIVGNLDRVYEIGHDFRNEGVDRTHNPEFTMLELYQAYADYESMMDLTEAMVTETLEAATGTLQFPYGGRVIDMSRPWKRIRYVDAMCDATGIDLREASRDDLIAAVSERTDRGDARELTRPQLVDILFGAAVEDEISNPTFVYDHPIEMSPLAKPHRNDPIWAERFELIVAGFELVNAFSELNDPLDQYGRFWDQQRLREAGDLEAMEIDEDYVRALEYGLPPTGGFGMGIDRLVMLATGQDTIREVVLFPTLRPEEGV